MNAVELFQNKDKWRVILSDNLHNNFEGYYEMAAWCKEHCSANVWSIGGANSLDFVREVDAALFMLRFA